MFDADIKIENYGVAGVKNDITVDPIIDQYESFNTIQNDYHNEGEYYFTAEVWSSSSSSSSQSNFG